MKTISTIADWDLNDLLPKNKWFYNYTHPNNLSVNWYVYKHKIYVPNSFKTNYISAVSQIVEQFPLEHKHIILYILQLVQYKIQ